MHANDFATGFISIVIVGFSLVGCQKDPPSPTPEPSNAAQTIAPTAITTPTPTTPPIHKEVPKPETPKEVVAIPDTSSPLSPPGEATPSKGVQLAPPPAGKPLPAGSAPSGCRVIGNGSFTLGPTSYAIATYKLKTENSKLNGAPLLLTAHFGPGEKASAELDVGSDTVYTRMSGVAFDCP